MAMMEVILSLVDNLSNEINSATSNIDDFEGSVKSASDAVDNIDTSSISDLSFSANEAGTAVGEISDAANDVSSTIGNIDPTPIKDTSDSAKDASNSMEDASESTGLLEGAMGALISLGVAEWFNEITEAAGGYGDAWMAFGNIVDSSANTVSGIKDEWTSNMNDVRDVTKRGLMDTMKTFAGLDLAGIHSTEVMEQATIAIQGMGFNMEALGRGSMQSVQSGFERIVMSGSLSARTLKNVGMSMEDLERITGKSSEQIQEEFKNMTSEERAMFLSDAMLKSGAQKGNEDYENSWARVGDELDRAFGYLNRIFGDMVIPIVKPALEAVTWLLKQVADHLKDLDPTVQKIIGGLILFGGTAVTIWGVYTSISAVATAAGIAETAAWGLLGPLAAIAALGVIVVTIAIIDDWSRSKFEDPNYINTLTTPSGSISQEDKSGTLGQARGFYMGQGSFIKNMPGMGIGLDAAFRNWDIAKPLGEGFSMGNFAGLGKSISELNLDWSGVWKGLEDANDKIEDLLDTIKETVFDTWDKIKDETKKIWDNIKKTITTIINSIKTSVTNVFNAIKTTAMNIWNTLKSGVSNIVSALKSTVVNIVDQIKQGVISGFNAIIGPASSAWNAIVNAVSGPINTIMGWINALRNAIGLGSVGGANLPFDAGSAVVGAGPMPASMKSGLRGAGPLPQGLLKGPMASTALMAMQSMFKNIRGYQELTSCDTCHGAGGGLLGAIENAPNVWPNAIINGVNSLATIFFGPGFDVRDPLGTFMSFITKMMSGFHYEFYYDEKLGYVDNAATYARKGGNCADLSNLVCAVAGAFGLPCERVHGFWDGIGHYFNNIPGIGNLDPTAFITRGSFFNSPSFGPAPANFEGFGNKVTLNYLDIDASGGHNEKKLKSFLSQHIKDPATIKEILRQIKVAKGGKKRAFGI